MLLTQKPNQFMILNGSIRVVLFLVSLSSSLFFSQNVGFIKQMNEKKNIVLFLFLVVILQNK
jgi:hypothetical protein